MPRGDGTGPAGAGPMTGRGAGYCAGYSSPGYTNPVPGRGFGRGAGIGRGGRGYRNWYYATGLPGWTRANQGLPAWGGTSYYGAQPYGQEVTPQQEADMLKQQSDYLKKELDGIQERISVLEKKATKEKNNKR